MTEAKQREKVKRKIIEIDEDLCTGCGKCVIACAEGALEIIDGKAKVVSEVFCDGLGACIGECPEGALKIIERNAFKFDEEEVEKHLEGMLEQTHLSSTPKKVSEGKQYSYQCNCPFANMIIYDQGWDQTEITEEVPSALRQWPIKLTLVAPTAPYFNNEELIIVSDCSPLAYGDFHRKILQGKPIVSVCPMLGLREIELDKIEEILKNNPIKKVNLILMEVPCCLKMKFFMDPIISKIDRKISVQETIISQDGKILHQDKL